MVVEEELAKLKKFHDSLRMEDKAVFQDILKQCRLYASAAGSLASPVKQIPLVMSILFAQHKQLTELEQRLKANMRENSFCQRTERRPSVP
jgi:hypothetical protein